MKKITLILLVVLVVITIFAGIYLNKKNIDDKCLIYGMGSGGWGPLYPAHQSSLYAAIIISHVFDSLVGVDNSGGFIPNLAKAWEINEDYTIYNFTIDTNRRFSDGTKLTAGLYKESLLHSLKLEAAATNKSALDVLYALKGFSDFKSSGNISGLEVNGDDRLIMSFKKPFRGAIAQLSGTRYGAYIKKSEEYLGTGPYVYSKIENNLVELSVNPYYPSPPAIKHIKITTDGVKELYNGTAHVVLAPFYSDQTQSKKIKTAEEILSSLLSTHWVIVVNGMENRIFSDKNLRKAAQYIVYNYIIEENSKLFKIPFFVSDIQFYPHLYPGRLDDSETKRLIDDGEKYIGLLKKASEKKPITCINRSSAAFDYCEAFNKYGINTVKQTSDFATTKKILYKTFEADLVSYGASYASADPDGLYHLLGKNGAIWTPLASREKVEKLAEEGRTLTDNSDINEHYKLLSMTIMEEIPVIHLGYQNLYLEYNSDLLKTTDKVTARRKALNVTLFQWR